MNVVMLICSDGVPTPQKSAAMAQHLDPYVREVVDGGHYVYGHRLAGPEAARTVRVRDGQILVSDGPFTESKEFVAGFDVLSFEDRDEAVATAARHPVSWFHRVALYEIDDRQGADSVAVRSPALFAGAPAGCQRCLVLPCTDGVPADDEATTQITRACAEWADRLRVTGISPFAAMFAPGVTATNVRVRGGERCVSDDPGEQATQRIAGAIVVDLPQLADAVSLAADHPLAHHGCVEVRPLWEE